MISRRNIRVKVMQTLYTLSAEDATGDVEKVIKKSSKVLDEKLSHSLDLFTTAILYTVSVAQYAETDARVRASRYLANDDDKNVNTKIAGNNFIWQTLSNETFKERVKSSRLEEAMDKEWVKKLYLQLLKTPEYQEYISLNNRSNKSEKAIIYFIWSKMLLGNEEFQQFLTDEISGWEDDKEMIVMLMDNFFRNGQNINYLVLLSPEKNEYAHALLRTAIEKYDYCMSLIEPKLINWETERVALIDLILLRMGICEMLYFPTIPTKVTINEYIEIAKQYSTPQSGHFVNAILDNTLKDLEKDQKINKQDRQRK